MIAVQSGPQEIGRWLGEERNVYEDYRRLFGQEPPRIAGIALMTDTDNTGESAVAYYDQIVLRPARSGGRQAGCSAHAQHRHPGSERGGESRASSA